MPLGYLAGLVATMPSWVAAIVTQDELDLAAPGEYGTGAFDTNRELLAAFDQALAKARQALAGGRRAPASRNVGATDPWAKATPGRVAIRCREVNATPVNDP